MAKSKATGQSGFNSAKWWAKWTRPVVTPEIRKERRREVWRGVMEKTVRLVGNPSLKLNVESLDKTFGKTTGSVITIDDEFFDAAIDDKDPVAGAMRLKGLTYHELAHFLYSPRRNHKVPRQVAASPDHALKMAYNLLEDQRVEGVFGARFVPARRYFESSVLEAILAGLISPHVALLALWGRPYMAPKLLADVSGIFTQVFGDPMAAEAKAIIDEYMKIDPVGDSNRAWGLVTRFAQLLRQASNESQQQGKGPIGDGLPDSCNDSGDQESGTPEAVTKSMQNGVGDSQKERDEKLKDLGPSDGKDLEQQIRDHARKGKTEIRQDQGMQDDANGTLKAVRDGMGKAAGTTGTEFSVAYRPPRSEETGWVNRCVKLLKDIKTDADPDIMRRRSQGRLDIQKVISANPNDLDVFTAYDEGSEDHTTAEAVLLVDTSGSMSGQPVVEVSSAVWVLKRAFDKVGFKTTVILFNSYNTVLWGTKAKSPTMVPKIQAGGGTSPVEALKDTEKILSTSNEYSKIMVMLTDGQWDEPRLAEAIISRIGKYSSTMLIGLDEAVSRFGNHSFERAVDLKSASQVPDVVKGLVAQIMRRVTTNRE